MSLVRLRAIWITNHPPSVLWHCWLSCKKHRLRNGLNCVEWDVKPCWPNQLLTYTAVGGLIRCDVLCRVKGEWVETTMMQYAGWPAGGAGSSAVPCQSCMQAQLLISVLRQGMHPACIDTSSQHAALPPLYVWTIIDVIVVFYVFVIQVTFFTFLNVFF